MDKFLRKQIPILTFILIYQGINTLLFCQILPTERTVNWKEAGITKIETDTWQTINFKHFQTMNSNKRDLSIDDLMDAAMHSLDGKAGIIYLPAGTYDFRRPIILRDSLILKGEGASQTSLSFDLNGKAHLIEARGNVSQHLSYLKESVKKGQKTLRIENEMLYKPGDVLLLTQNDSQLVTSNWALGSVGQIIEVERVLSDGLILKQALRKSYLLADAPSIRKINPVSNVGIECLSIQRGDITKSQSSNIFFSYVKNAWIRNVESTNCNFAHIEIDHSSHIELTGNYLHHAHDYGSGGKWKCFCV